MSVNWQRVTFSAYELSENPRQICTKRISMSSSVTSASLSSAELKRIRKKFEMNFHSLATFIFKDNSGNAALISNRPFLCKYIRPRLTFHLFSVRRRMDEITSSVCFFLIFVWLPRGIFGSFLSAILPSGCYFLGPDAIFPRTQFLFSLRTRSAPSPFRNDAHSHNCCTLQYST